MERTLSQLLPGANKVVNALRLRTKAFIAGLIQVDAAKLTNTNVAGVTAVKRLNSYCRIIRGHAAVRQLMSDPESQLMAAVAIGIGTLNNRLLLLMSTPARYLSTS